MQEHEQQIVSSHIFPAELSQWFTTPLQQTSIIYTSQPTNIVQQQNDRPIQIPILDKSVATTCETSDVAFVGYIMQPQPDQNHHQILEVQNISMENITQHPRTNVNPNDYLSVVMVEPKIKDAATNTDERWDAKKLLSIKKPVLKTDISLLKPETTELTVLEQQFHCQLCAKNFSSLSALMNHDKCSHAQKSHDYMDCGKKVATSSPLQAHECVEKVTEPLVCQICNIYFSNLEIFMKHKESHQVNVTRKFVCDLCGLEFSDVNDHKKHLRIHSETHICKICDKSFSSSSTLMHHKRTHSGERPYKCDFCNKRFFTKAHAQTHRRVHSGERPFSCNFCGRAFADGSSHRRHERLHQPNKKHQCEVCGRGFPLAITLSKHLAKHHSYT